MKSDVLCVKQGEIVMANTKKVILFIVEGITDKISLEGILSTLIETENVKFQITEGDMTTEKGITV